jgi:hypothetical protein
LIAAALSCASTASAATIGINYVRTGDHVNNTDLNSLAADAQAGGPGYEQSNWNNLGRWGDSVILNDSTGAASGVSIAWDATGTYSQSGTVVDQLDPNANLMNSYLDSNGSANTDFNLNLYSNSGNNKPLIYISGLSAWLATQGATAYDVVLYSDGDASSGRAGEYWLVNATGPYSEMVTNGDMSTHVFIRDTANFINTLSYVEVPQTSDNGVGAFIGNYTVFKGLSADSFLLRTAEYNTRAPVNAFQIVPRTTPVPADLVPLQSSVVYPGATASFRVTAAGVLPITFKWQKNGTDLTDSGNVSGSGTATLTIANVSAADAGTYTVIVTNPGGTTNSSATLQLTSPASGSYAQKVATNQPYAYWRLNENEDVTAGTAPAYDFVGGFNGTYGVASQNLLNGINGPQPPTFPGFETGNGALMTTPASFRSWVTVPPLNLSTNTVTITAWIYPTANQASYSGIFFSRNGSDASGLGFYQNNQLGYTWNTNASATYGFASKLVVPTNKWSFVALVVTPTNATLYLYNADGTLSAENPIPHGVETFAGRSMIGWDSYDTGRAFTGTIDEVAVWNRSLSSLEVYNYYKKGLGLTAIAAAVTTQPLNSAIMAGRTAKFTASVVGDAPITYNWRKNASNLSDGNNISGATTPTLVITGVSEADAGSYDLHVSNVAGSDTSTAATLTVVSSNSAPVAYEAALRDANPLAYWRLDETSGTFAYDYWGGVIANHESVNVGVDGPQPPAFVGLQSGNKAASYDGVSSATYTTANLLNNLGQFSIIGWFNTAQPPGSRLGLFGQNDAYEFGFFDNGELGIWTPGGGLVAIDSSYVNPGEWYFAAAVGDGTKTGVYLFSTNGVVQSVVQQATTNYGSSTFPFRIGGGGVLDASGNFFLGEIDEVAVFDRALSLGELSTLFGAASRGGALPPVVSVQPTGGTWYAGLDATLSVSAVGSEPLQYRWRKNGANLSDTGNISGSDTPVLSIKGISSANAGDYDVVISNGTGSITSSNAAVAVITPMANSYEEVIIGLKPYSYWRLNETEGTAATDYWGGRNGTYGAAAVFGVPGVVNPPFVGFESTNKAVQTTADTVGSYVSVPLGSLSTNTVTFTAWLYPVGTQTAWAGLITSRGGSAAGGVGYNGDQMLAYTWNGNTTWSFSSGLVIPTDMWSFIAVVIAPDKATLYLKNANGETSATNAIAHTSDTFGTTWLIGRDNNSSADDGSRTFNGVIDEVAVFTQSLTPDQVQLLYASGLSGAPLKVSVQRSGTNIIVTWPKGTLLQADDVSGPWTVVTGATSPYTTSAASGNKFFRVQQ